MNNLPGGYQPGNPPNGQRDLHYEFQRHRPEFFKVGRVIALEWSEAEGINLTGNHSQCTVSYHGQHLHHKILRVVVVKEIDKGCWCVPINTYGGKGALKANLDLSTHAPILNWDGKPPPLHVFHMDNGDMIDFEFYMRPRNPWEPMDPRSLINFGKVYTIENNWRVKHYGDVLNLEELRREYNRHCRSLAIDTVL